MKKILYLFLILIFSCSINKGLTSLTFKGFDNLNKKKYHYTLFPPKDFILKVIEGGNEWHEKQCVYSDNSILYINNENGIPTINFHNISKDSLSMKKNFSTFISGDTLTVFGVDNQGNHWKNKRYKQINIGYLNVSNERLEEFDKALLLTLKSQPQASMLHEYSHKN